MRSSDVTTCSQYSEHSSSGIPGTGRGSSGLPIPISGMGENCEINSPEGRENNHVLLVPSDPTPAVVNVENVRRASPNGMSSVRYFNNSDFAFACVDLD